MQSDKPAAALQDVALIYPTVRLAFHTVAIVDGKPVEIMGDEVFDIKEKGDEGARKMFNQMLMDFRKYMKGIQATRLTPDVLQRILDNQKPAAPKIEEDRQGSLFPELAVDSGSYLPDSPAPRLPVMASESARTPEAGTTQSE